MEVVDALPFGGELGGPLVEAALEGVEVEAGRAEEGGVRGESA